MNWIARLAVIYDETWAGRTRSARHFVRVIAGSEGEGKRTSPRERVAGCGVGRQAATGAYFTKRVRGAEAGAVTALQ